MRYQLGGIVYIDDKQSFFLFIAGTPRSKCMHPAFGMFVLHEYGTSFQLLENGAVAPSFGRFKVAADAEGLANAITMNQLRVVTFRGVELAASVGPVVIRTLTCLVEDGNIPVDLTEKRKGLFSRTGTAEPLYLSQGGGGSSAYLYIQFFVSE